MSAHDRFIDDVGAYLLGALEPGEEREFEQHLETCDACRQEVVRLEVARDALPRSVDQVAPPKALKASLMSTVRAEAAEAAPSPAAGSRAPARRSRWRELLLARPRFAAAAAAVLLAVGIAAGALVGAIGGGSDDPATVAATVDQARMPAGQGSLSIPEDGGAILRVDGMQQPGDDRVYEVWIQRGNQVTPSSLFNVESDGSGAAAIPDELKGADAILVTREPAGGSKRPSERPVLTVPLPS